MCFLFIKRRGLICELMEVVVYGMHSHGCMHSEFTAIDAYNPDGRKLHGTINVSGTYVVWDGFTVFVRSACRTSVAYHASMDLAYIVHDTAINASYCL